MNKKDKKHELSRVRKKLWDSMGTLSILKEKEDPDSAEWQELHGYYDAILKVDRKLRKRLNQEI